MAVELAKLSLWLVTLAKGKPFSFLDHALRHGDSLIGVTSAEQIGAFHLDPERGRNLNLRIAGDVGQAVDKALSEASELRREIEAAPVEDVRDAEDKARRLAEAESLTGRLRLAADAVVGAALSTASVRSPDAYDDRLTAVADDVRQALRWTARGDSSAEDGARELVDGWLRGDRAEPIRPLHWPLEFPEVFAEGGFDAVMGNPPFVGGQKITGAYGHDYRDYLVRWIAKDHRGSADLCSYFLLRDRALAREGRVGSLATNTIGQGDTREVGLDQLTDRGWSVYRAVKSQPWPGAASLEVSLVWAGHAGEEEHPVLDGREVRGITPSLDPRSRVTGNPYRLAANEGQSFQGSNILGTGFTLPPEDARALIEKDPRNKDVLFPYLNGEDLNSRPDCSASRWVINFHDWSEEQAQEYPEPFAIVKREVKPQRAKSKRKFRRERWWRFAEHAPNLYKAIADLDRVLVLSQTSRTQVPAFVSAKQVLAHKLVVFATDAREDLALRTSEFQYWWTIRQGSTMRTDTVYTPSDCCDTFPRPPSTRRVELAGEVLESHRGPLMLRRQLGLTALYNRVHDPDDRDPEVERLRAIHVEIDEAVREAYDWDDLSLDHGFHDTRQGTRFTIGPDAQVEVCDRLLALNFDRYADEVRQGLHRTRQPGRGPTRSTAASTPSPASQSDALF